MSTDAARTDPRISVNKLGEYMSATPLRRRRIVQDQKRPRPFIVPRYNEASAAIVSYLVGGAADDAMLLAEIERLSQADSETEWEEQRKLLCVEAIERFLDMADQLDGYLRGSGGLMAESPAVGSPRAGRAVEGGIKVEPAAVQQPRLTLGGLEISVRPEILLSGQERAGQPFAGAIKLYFSKTIPLTPESGLYVATAVHLFVSEHISPEHAHHRHCHVIDVFAGQIHTAPRSFIRRRNDLVAACEEITRAWTMV